MDRGCCCFVVVVVVVLVVFVLFVCFCCYCCFVIRWMGGGGVFGG